MVPKSSLGALAMPRRPGADPGDGYHGPEQAEHRVYQERALDPADQIRHRGTGRDDDGGVHGEPDRPPPTSHM